MAFCYFDGEYLDESEASISIHNLGVHRAFGIFDFFRARNKKPTFIEDYLDRFDRSQKFLNLSRLIEQGEVIEVIDQLQVKNGFENSSYKMILLGEGTDEDSVLNPLFFIIHAPYEDLGLVEGSLIMEPYVRENPLIKNLNYFTSYQVHQRKHKANAVDVLYHDQGIISEASRSNIFMIKDGVLFTPEKNILHGVTRKNILTMSQELMEVKITDIQVDDLLTADEVFLSSTLKEIMPIVKIEDRVIGNGKAGEQTLKLRSEFKSYISDYTNR